MLPAEALTPLERPSATGQVVARLEQLLCQGVLGPGMQLPPERELAKVLGVSRSSLREALQALREFGVLEARHGAGNFIATGAPRLLERATAFFIPLTRTSLLELTQTRMALETALAGLAAEHAAEQDLTAMAGHLAAMRRHLDDLDAYIAEEEQFHQAIATAAGNSLMLMLMALLQDRLRAGRRRTGALRSAHVSYGEHEAIYRAIAARDAPAARAAMSHHLDQVEHLVHGTTQGTTQQSAHAQKEH